MNIAAIISSRRTPLNIIDADYYVSATGTGIGDTSSNPMSFEAAKLAIPNMTAGEVMAFKRGDRFDNQYIYNDTPISGTLSNPIVFTFFNEGWRSVTSSLSSHARF